MPLGPFDRRKIRSRCHACAASHLKCSGHQPCRNCQRRQIFCDFSSILKNNARVKVDNGKLHIGPAGSANQDVISRTSLLMKPQSDRNFYHFCFFNTFLLKNKFNQRSWVSADLIELMQRSTSRAYLRDAVLALGAMQAVRLSSSEGVSESQSNKSALNFYSNSVIGLRGALNEFAQSPCLRDSILWATYLLGLFELMNDSTGQGWIQHLVHGTSMALVAAGPMAFESGLSRRFFLEIKIFEVCRAIVFNEQTFLADIEWRDLSVRLQTHAQVHPLDTLLDIIVSCSTLRVRTRNLIYSSENISQGDALIEGHSISAEGFRLRQALTIWQQRENRPFDTIIKGSDEFMFLAMVFFAATSIYLSGVFDYEINHWQGMGIPVPNLSEDEIQDHVHVILELSSIILTTTSISPVLVLFPLRVAGARSWQDWQQEQIQALLGTVGQTFPVASAFKGELSEVWATRKAKQIHLVK